MRRLHEARSSRRSRSKGREHVLRGAGEPDHENVHASVHAAYEWLQQKAGKSRGSRGAVLHVVQLRTDSSDAENDSRDGCWNCFEALDCRADRRANRWLKLTHYPPGCLDRRYTKAATGGGTPSKPNLPRST